VASGVDATPDDLAPQVLLPGRKGSLQLDLVGATRRQGRVPYVLPRDPSAILAEVSAGRPVVVLQNLALPVAPQWHYAVVVGYDAGSRSVLLRSGREPRLELRWSRFYQTWEYAGRWAMVVLRPGELPVSGDAHGYLAAVAGVESAGEITVAAASYLAATERWPAEPLAWLALGNASYYRGDLAGAARAYRQAVALAPDDPASLNNLAQALAELGCKEAAERSALHAITVAEGPLLDASRQTLAALPAVAPVGACPVEFRTPPS
jgi:tetratricopeptide (TPR) repeat protein